MAAFCRVGFYTTHYSCFSPPFSAKNPEPNSMTVRYSFVRLILKYLLFLCYLVYIFEKRIIMYMRELKGCPAKLNAINIFTK